MSPRKYFVSIEMKPADVALAKSKLSHRCSDPLSCCHRSNLNHISLEDAAKCVDDSCFVRKLGKQSWHVYIKSCVLLSLPKNDPSEHSEWMHTCHQYKIPASKTMLCRNAFLFLLGISPRTLTTITSDCLRHHSVHTEPHGLEGRKNKNANKHDFERNIGTTKVIEGICMEVSIIPPWSVPKGSETRPVKCLPTYFSKSRLYSLVQDRTSDNLNISRTSFYRMLYTERFSHLRFCQNEKGLCDLCGAISESIRGLKTHFDPISRARLISMERRLQNHIVRHRMSRFLYRMCQAKVRNLNRPTHELEDDITALPGFDTEGCNDEEVRNELTKLRNEGTFEEEELFEVNPPWAPGQKVACISWDYAHHLSIPHKAFERMQDHIASVLGYNVYLFGLVDEATSIQHNFVYGEQHESKGASTVASIVYHYLRHYASHQVQNAEHLVVVTDGCGGENRNRIICGFLRSFLREGTLPSLRRITMVMMERGHTKFAPDTGFGLIRRHEKNTTTETMDDVINIGDLNVVL